MKYIMMKDCISDRHIPVLFPDYLIHERVAASMEREIERSMKTVVKTISAGFVFIINDEFVTHGRSESLNMESRKIDGVYMTLGDAAAFMTENFAGHMLHRLKDVKKSD